MRRRLTDPALDSSDFSPEDWVTLANQIGKNYHEFDGFVVLHGTDTMAYSASALSFMLEGLSKPVIFTGAQVPLSEIYNDAKRNLIVAILLAGLMNEQHFFLHLFSHSLFLLELNLMLHFP
jgi:L-asparaginase